MTIVSILLLLSIVCFTLGAFQVPRANWMSAGWAFLVAAILFGKGL